MNISIKNNWKLFDFCSFKKIGKNSYFANHCLKIINIYIFYAFLLVELIKNLIYLEFKIRITWEKLNEDTTFI